MNNLKLIRELYGATQEQVARAISANRVTIANWESGNFIASSSSREKLSLYYGIGPDYFYEKELDETARNMVVAAGAKAVELAKKSGGKLSKEDDFRRAFETISFSTAMRNYMFSMKMMLATADSGELDKLKTASLINKKMGKRLDAIIHLREQEIDTDEPSLHELMELVQRDEND